MEVGWYQLREGRGSVVKTKIILFEIVFEVKGDGHRLDTVLYQCYQCGNVDHSVVDCSFSEY